MALQRLQDGPYVDPPVASGSALTGTTAVDLWAGSDFTPILGRDAHASKIYIVEADGVWSTGASGTLILAPGLGTSSPGTTMGVSPTTTVPINLTAVSWSLRAKLTVRTIGAKGANSTIMCNGTFWSSGTAATAGSATVISFGGTSCLFDSTVENWFTLQKTLSVAGSMTVHSADIFARNQAIVPAMAFQPGPGPLVSRSSLVTAAVGTHTGTLAGKLAISSEIVVEWSTTSAVSLDSGGLLLLLMNE